MKDLTAPWKWTLPEEDRAACRSLATALRIPGVVAQLLRARGLDTEEAAKAFLNTQDAELGDPFEMTDMQRTVERVTLARAQGEHVRVFGDYDVDGITATAILTRGLRRFGIECVSHRMPDRLTEGYGLNANSVEQAAQDGVKLMLTVDNGISAFEAADAAKRIGIDLIVTDHHHIDGRLPDAHAIINPKRDDPESASADACGAVIAFKLAWALTGEPADYDLAALATIADVMPLHNENRLLVVRGLHQLSEGTHLGLKALVRKVGLIPGSVSAENIAFQISPRINASGRLGFPEKALQLFMTDSEDEAGLLAAELDAANTERRKIEAGILEEAKEQVQATWTEGQASIVVAGEGWHPGVVGIVAARLQNAYWCPATVIAIDQDGQGRGSCRSTPSFNIVEALGECRHLLVKHGGHQAAAGLTIEEQNIPELRDRLEAAAQRHAALEEDERELKIDAMLALSEIDNDLLRAVDTLEPYGHGNPAPLFASYGVEVVPGSLRELKGGHLKMTVKQGRRAFPAIGFGLAERFPANELGSEIDIAFRPKFNTWRGETTIQLELKDLRPA